MNIDFHIFVDNFVSAIEAKDAYTAGHSDRVADIALIIAKELNLNDVTCEMIHMAGHLHDIGKIGIPDGILLKGGKLTNAEFDVMKSHSEIGYNILKNNIGLREVAINILYHHERYDGNGYPHKICGKDIPLCARIISVADSFDAMVTRRTYKEKMNINQAIAEIKLNSGKQFDPEIAKVFVNVLTDSEKRKNIIKILT